MIEGFFDDSGTHAGSKVVVWAGVLATPDQWRELTVDWCSKLANPCPSLPAKAPIKTFHMHDCFNSTGEFERWSRTETDFLVHELVQIILKHEIWGYAAGVWRPEFDELVPATLHFMTGDAEGLCIRNMFVKTLGWMNQYTQEREISFTFDDRPQRAKDSKFVSSVFQGRGGNISIGDVKFGAASKLVPLQVADLFAWETYRGCVLLHETSSHEPMRRPLSQLGQSKRFAIQYADRDALARMAKMAEQEPSDRKAIMRKHFEDNG